MAGPLSHNRNTSLLRAGLTGLVMLASHGAAAQEVQILLSNGDRLTGKVLAEDTQRVTLTNALLGRFTVPVAQVDRRISAAGVTTAAMTNKAPAAPAPPPTATNSTLARQLDDLL